jgi:two-component system phosphate regulon response regulator PhoB
MKHGAKTMSESSILLVEDEKAVRDMLRFVLTQAGYGIQEAGDAAEARLRLAEKQPDMILLDWMLPDTSGIELAREFKRDPCFRHIPLIILTARGEEDSRVRGLEAGADDYIVKPFSSRELVARIKAVWRRAAPEAGDEVVEINGLRLDPTSYRVTADNQPLELGPTEFRLLHFFMTHQERVYSRGQLLDRVWGSNVHVEDRTVDVYILRLRKALKTLGHDDLLQTVRGAGYRFSAKA